MLVTKTRTTLAHLTLLGATLSVACTAGIPTKELPPDEAPIRAQSTAAKIGCSGERTIQGIVSNDYLDFSDAPEFEEVTPGSVSVIFKDEYKVRKRTDRTGISAALQAMESELNGLLKRHRMRSLADSSGSENDEASNSREMVAERHWKVDIPNAKSMFTFRFSESADTKRIAQLLRALPSVRTAYPTPALTPASSPVLVSRWSFSNLSGPFTNDRWFTGIYAPYEKEYWHWYNRHRMFDAWQAIAGQPLPAIAVIDSGFATFDTTHDTPTYQTGQSFDEFGNMDGTDVIDPTDHLMSHGTRMAEVLASPSNNNAGWAGALPGAPVVPIRASSVKESGSQELRAHSSVKFHLDSVAAAIRYAPQRAETISISIQANGKPIVWDPILRAAVADATAAGASVVICAGNRRYDLDLDFPGSDAGAIIVGGSDRDTGQNWVDSGLAVGMEGAGTNYGTPVHVTASAKNIWAATYSPYYGFWQNQGLRGTSYSTPMVAATIAMTRELLKTSRPDLIPADLHRVAKQIVWGSGTISSNNGDDTQHGYLLEQSCRNSGGAMLRDLNMANAFEIAMNADRELLVRVTNGDDETQVAKNEDWPNAYFIESLSADAIWDFSAVAATSTRADRLSFRINNLTGQRSHGYQIWKRGLLTNEHLGGASERRAPWPSGSWTQLHPTVGENSGATDVGWQSLQNFPAM